MITDDGARFLIQGSTEEGIIYWIKWLLDNGFKEEDFIRCFNYELAKKKDYIEVDPNVREGRYITVGNTYLWFGFGQFAAYNSVERWRHLFENSYKEIKL